MKNEFYKWYKQRFEKLAEEPPAEVWETISRTLDKEAMPSQAKKKWKRFAVPLLFLVIGLSGTYFFSRHADKKIILASNEIIFTQEDAPSLKGGVVLGLEAGQIQAATPKRNKLKVVETGLIQLPPKEFLPSTPSPNFPADITETTATTALLEKEEVKPEQIPIVIRTDDSVNAILNPSAHNNTIYSQSSAVKQQRATDNGQLTKDTSPTHILPVGFYFGNSFTLNNSWLLNHDTKNGLNKNSLDDVNLYFGTSYALLSGYNFSDKFSAQAEWMVYNKQGQKYIDYNEGHQTTRDELLDYCQFNFMVKKKTTRMAFNATTPLSFFKLAGIHYSILKSAKDVINNETISAQGSYTNNNYGVILGFGYEAILKNHWLVSTSLRMDAGLKNIYAGSPAMPSQFNRTYNSSLGMQLSLAYLFIKSPK